MGPGEMLADTAQFRLQRASVLYTVVMWLYQLIRSTRKSIPYWLMGLLILEGWVGLCLMFVFPPGSLAMVFIGLLTLLCSGVVKSLLSMLERSVGRILGVQTGTTEASSDPTPHS